jgi:hypothetical protein
MKIIGQVGQPEQAKGVEGKVKPKHISEISPAQRARADEKIRECLLAIVLQQAKPVKIPLAVLDAASSLNRLVISVDGENVILHTEKADILQS